MKKNNFRRLNTLAYWTCSFFLWLAMFSQHLVGCGKHWWPKYCTDWPCSKDKWCHTNDINFVKNSEYVPNQIPHKMHFFLFFIFCKLTKWPRFVTYLWNDILYWYVTWYIIFNFQWYILICMLLLGFWMISFVFSIFWLSLIFVFWFCCRAKACWTFS